MRARKSPTATRDTASATLPRRKRTSRGERLVIDSGAVTSAYTANACLLLGQNLTSKGGLMPQLVRTSARLPARSAQKPQGKSHQPLNSPQRGAYRGWAAPHRGRKGVPFRDLSLE